MFRMSAWDNCQAGLMGLLKPLMGLLYTMSGDEVYMERCYWAASAGGALMIQRA